jgi:hypothetical protein
MQHDTVGGPPAGQTRPFSSVARPLDSEQSRLFSTTAGPEPMRRPWFARCDAGGVASGYLVLVRETAAGTLVTTPVAFLCGPLIDHFSGIGFIRLKISIYDQ